MKPSMHPRKRAADVRGRIASTTAPGHCASFGCTRPTMAAAGAGLSTVLCRYHVQWKARHGSEWCGTFKAADLKPHRRAAAAWVRQHREDPAVVRALSGLGWLMAFAGPVERANEIKRKPAAHRAKVALARLQERSISPERLLTTHIAVTALIEDDREAHKRSTEFRIVQVAKAVHRLASGTHWNFGGRVPGQGRRALKDAIYPKSSGRVLRVLGGLIEAECRGVTWAALQEVRALKLAQSGPHPTAFAAPPPAPWVPPQDLPRFDPPAYTLASTHDGSGV